MLVLQHTKLAHAENATGCVLVRSTNIELQVNWCYGPAHARLNSPFHYCGNVNCKSTHETLDLSALSTTGKQLHHG